MSEYIQYPSAIPAFTARDIRKQRTAFPSQLASWSWTCQPPELGAISTPKPLSLSSYSSWNWLIHPEMEKIFLSSQRPSSSKCGKCGKQASMAMASLSKALALELSFTMESGQCGWEKQARFSQRVGHCLFHRFQAPHPVKWGCYQTSSRQAMALRRG